MKRVDLDNKTKSELLDLARDLEVRGRSLMSKKQLIQSIEKAWNGAVADPVVSPKKAKTTPSPVATIKAKPKLASNVNALGAKLKSKRKVDGPVTPVTPLPTLAVTPVPVPQWSLPHHYGSHRLVLMVIDPTHVYAYWELWAEKVEAAREGQMADMVLRVYDVTDVDFNGHNAWRYDDHYVGLAQAWYLDTRVSKRTFVAELGWLSQGVFRAIVRSNVVRTPSDVPSTVVDDQWMIVEADFDRIYALSGGMPHGLWEKASASAGWQRDQMAMRLRLGLSSHSAPHIGQASL